MLINLYIQVLPFGHLLDLFLFYRWLLRKHGNKSRICWIRPSNEAVSYTELLHAKGPHGINRFGQSSKLAPSSVARKQATALSAINKARHEVPESCRWRSEGAVDRAQWLTTTSSSANKSFPSSYSLPHSLCHFIYQLIMRLAFAKSAYLAQQCRGFGSFIWTNTLHVGASS